MSRGTYCIVQLCYNNKFDNPDIAFFHLPKDTLRAKNWIELAKRLDLLQDNLYSKKSYRVCSSHFSPSQFKKTYPRILLNSDAFPDRLLENNEQISATMDPAEKLVELKPVEPISEITHDELSPHPKKQRVGASDTLCASKAILGEDSPSTPLKRKSSTPRHSSPRSQKRLNKYIKNVNLLRCKLFRRRKESISVCGRLSIGSSRARFALMLRDAKGLLSQNAYTLFHSELHTAFTNKFNRRYSDEMKQLCLVWYYSSPKGYKTMAKTINLPTPRTLRNWTSNCNINTGINKGLTESIKLRFNSSNILKEKYAALLFDEISIKEELHYDSSKDKIIGVVDNGATRTNEKSKSALVCMARGIVHNWKSVIGYWFLGGKETTANMYNIVMQSLDAAIGSGIIVKCIVTDQAPSNQGLATKLGILKSKPYFMYNAEKVYFIYDVPHLLKSTRNMLSKYDLQYKEKVVSWRHIENVVKSTHPLRVRLIPKITPNHLNVTSFNAMKVKYAAHVFSDTMSVALIVLKHLNVVDSDAEQTSIFVKDMDTLFDCLNSCTLDDNKIKMRYAISQESPHEAFLKEMKDILGKSSFIGAKRPACLKGWEITIGAIVLLAEVLRCPEITNATVKSRSPGEFFCNNSSAAWMLPKSKCSAV